MARARLPLQRVGAQPVDRGLPRAPLVSSKLGGVMRSHARPDCRSVDCGLHVYNTEGTFRRNRDWVDDTSIGILAPSLVGRTLHVLNLDSSLRDALGRAFRDKVSFT